MDTPKLTAEQKKTEIDLWIILFATLVGYICFTHLIYLSGAVSLLSALSGTLYSFAFKGEWTMSKYDSLWEYVQGSGKESLQLTFEEIQGIAGIPIDHSFLKYKKELAGYGYEVGKISMKEQTVIFHKTV